MSLRSFCPSSSSTSCLGSINDRFDHWLAILTLAGLVGGECLAGVLEGLREKREVSRRTLAACPDMTYVAMGDERAELDGAASDEVHRRVVAARAIAVDM